MPGDEVDMSKYIRCAGSFSPETAGERTGFQNVARKRQKLGARVQNLGETGTYGNGLLETFW